MRITIVIALLAFFFSACKKDNFTTAPQIKYKSVNPNFTSINIGSITPTITFHITDAEGDIGFKGGADIAFIYRKNILTGDTDSLPFPDLQTAAQSNFEADVEVKALLRCRPIPSGQLHIDTLYFEIYVKDFAKNKSNVITTSDPVYFNCR